MAKILLVVEDYQELVRLETFLRKLGFDVSGVSNEYSLSEQFISFHPDILVVCGRQTKVSPISVAQKAAKTKNFQGKVLLSFFDGQRPNPSELAGVRMDAMIDAPIQEFRLVEVLAKMTGVSIQQLVQKLARTFRSEGVDDIEVGGGWSDPQTGVGLNDDQRDLGNENPAAEKSANTGTDQPQESQSKHQKVVGEQAWVKDYKNLFAGEELPPTTTTGKGIVKKKWASVGVKDDPALNEEKKRFVKALFKKND